MKSYEFYDFTKKNPQFVYKLYVVMSVFVIIPNYV